MFRSLYKIIILSFMGISAQENGNDSLKRIRLEAQLLEISEKSHTNIDSAFTALDALEPVFRNQSDWNLKADFLLTKATILLDSKRHLEIIDLLEPLLQNHKKLALSRLANSYKHIGHAYKIEWVPDSALVNYIRALKLYEKVGDNKGLSLTYLSLGLTYSKLGNKGMASDFYDKSLKFSPNSKIIEKHKEHITEQKIRPVGDDKIIELSLDIEKIAKEQGNDRLLMITYSDLKKAFLEMKDYEKALDYALRELEVRGRTHNYSLAPKTQYFIAHVYALQGKPQQAIMKYREALPGSTDSLRLSIYSGLKKAFIQTGNLKEAISTMENYTALKDSVHERNMEVSIAGIMAQYKTELQQEQIKNLSVENDLKTSKISNQQLTLFGTIGGSVLLLFLGLFGYKNYRTKQELNYTQLNFKLLQTQLNPHFMFNALNEIKLNMNEADTVSSAEYLTSYSKLMRSILEGSTKEFISLDDDIQLISKFLQLQQLLYNHKFQFEVNVSEGLNTLYLQIPPMLTQPFVENAIIHGVKNVEKGKITVNYRKENENVLIEVIDNGKGVGDTDSQSGNKLYTSLGTSIIADRIKTYQKLYNFKIEIITKSLKDKGTNVTIKFPKRIKTV